jgi:hypothetical protein
MNGDGLMRGLLVFYLILAAVFAYELNWAKSLYWVSAGLLTLSVLWMK